ncbi:DMT family transporter [Roseivivax sp. GX 12232]|uniref:DMT family transporter n=1 Tax=Roseivivax sp. GX 12232 TaxID=2900547 RepID=UPI001E3B2747|nr:DMT family transporter [Roseivivax sp. GX 12232]MCE0506501.1 DMT family transporter [Roseivivax sp. GX 12232]
MDNLRGALLMILAMAAFAVEDAFIKTAARELPTGQILIVIGVVGGLFFGLLARRRGIRLFTRDLLDPPIMVRNISEILGTIGFITAITTIPLSTASAVAQAMPLVVTLGAALIFGEPVGWRRWSAIFAGLAGVLVIIRPGLQGFDPNALWAVLAVVGLAGRDLSARAVPGRVPHMQLAAYGFLTLIPTGLILLAASGARLVWPDLLHAGLLAGAVGTGMIAYYAITSASRTGDVSFVTPFRFTRMLFALAIGIAIFGERPDALTYLGATVIVGAGIYTFLRERRLAQQGAKTPARGGAAGTPGAPAPAESQGKGRPPR